MTCIFVNGGKEYELRPSYINFQKGKKFEEFDTGFLST